MHLMKHQITNILPETLKWGNMFAKFPVEIVQSGCTLRWLLGLLAHNSGSWSALATSHDDIYAAAYLRITYKRYCGLLGMITYMLWPPSYYLQGILRPTWDDHMYMLQPTWQCWNCIILWAGITSCWQCWCTAGRVAPSVFTWNTISSPCYLHWPYAIIIPILWLICICTSWWALMLNI